VGQQIVVDSKQYRSGSLEGRRLLAHELAHTIQQSATRVGEPRRLARQVAPDAEAPSLSETVDPASLSDSDLMAKSAKSGPGSRRIQKAANRASCSLIPSQQLMRGEV
jgi:hypothetical protein